MMKNKMFKDGPAHTKAWSPPPWDGGHGQAGTLIPVDDLSKVRSFETGATRDTEEGKYDYDGFLSPLVLERYAEYMNKHRVQSDGNLRASDNWTKGIPKSAYMKSGWRHFFDWWKVHRNVPVPDGTVPRQQLMEEALCALLFNVQGYLHEHLKEKIDEDYYWENAEDEYLDRQNRN